MAQYSSIHAPSGNINIVLEIHTYTASGYLNTAEIEKHVHTPSGHINTVPINLTYMFSDNLNTCAINKYTSPLSDDNQTVAMWQSQYMCNDDNRTEAIS